MADKMMRIAGRGNDGLAKPIKIDSDGNLNVRNMKNIETELVWENKPIVAGEAFGYAIENFDAKKINLAISLATATKFRLEIEQRPPVGALPIGKTVTLIETGTASGIASFDLVSERMLIRIKNEGTTDTVIKGMLITKIY